jgi:type IX secretion system PorP/SprF family membrane protein
MIKILALGAFVLLSYSVSGQDLHFTNYRNTPILFNPSETGQYNGDIKLGAITRQQFSSFIDKPYTSLAFNAEVNTSFALRKYDWTSIGISVAQDRAGDLDLGLKSGMLSVAYHFSNSAKYTSIYTLGIQFGSGQYKLNADKAIYGQASEKTKLDNFSKNYTDFAIGINYFTKINTSSYLKSGVALQHFLSPEFNGIVKNNKVSGRINLNINYGMILDKKVTLEPAIYFSKYSNFYNTNLQMMSLVNLSAKSKQDILLKTGMGYRVGDAIEILLGGRYKTWNIDLAYDITVSSASLYTNHNGAIELSISKMFVIPKTPKVKPIIICPRL